MRELEPKDLYCIAVSQFQVVVQLLWARYSGFLVLHGLIGGVLSLAASGARNEGAALAGLLGGSVGLALIAMFGVLTACTWQLLNYLGWLSQNLHLQVAANLRVVPRYQPYFTNYFEGRVKGPHGLIYRIAQIPPVLFLVFYTVILGCAMADLYGTGLAVWSSQAVFGSAAATVWALERREFNRRRGGMDVPPS